MSSFGEEHPFLGGLVKRIITIVVAWNTVLCCLVGTFFLLAAIGAGFAVAAGTDAETLGFYTPVYGDGANQFLSVPVTGIMMGSNASEDSLSSLFSDSSTTYGYEVKEKLYKAADDPAIAGVILEIDSPGGTIYGANAISEGVAYYREQTRKPVYAHIEGLGASAAYWAAASTDKIFADYGSSVGSIGVIMGPIQFYDKVVATDGGLLGGGVVTQNGVESVNITAGKYKDLGDPYRRMTPAEVSLLQQSVNAEYDDFVSFVSKRRGIPDATIRNDLGAMIYDSKAAKRLKLTDEVGSRQAAYDALAKAANKGSDYTIVREQFDPGFVGSILGAVNRWRQPPKAQASPQDKQAAMCALTKTALAYHGDITAWCATK